MTFKPEPGDTEKAQAVITDFESYLSGWPEFARCSFFGHERDKLASLIALALRAEREDQRERDAKAMEARAVTAERYARTAIEPSGEFEYRLVAKAHRAGTAAIRSGSRPQPEEGEA